METCTFAAEGFQIFRAALVRVYMMNVATVTGGINNDGVLENHSYCTDTAKSVLI